MHGEQKQQSQINSVALHTSTPKRSAKVSQRILSEVAVAISNIRGWGSVEIFIQDNKVTQITERNIHKTESLTVTEEPVL